MDWIVLDGVKPYDGRYEFDLAAGDFTTREWGWIKRLSGYLPLNIEEGFEGGDPELYAVLATIALHRAGRVEQREVPDVFNRIGDAPFAGTIRLEIDPEPDKTEDDDSPPPRSSSANGGSSGAESPTSSATSPTTPGDSGTPASDTSASHPTRLAT